LPPQRGVRTKINAMRPHLGQEIFSSTADTPGAVRVAQPCCEFVMIVLPVNAHEDRRWRSTQIRQMMFAKGGNPIVVEGRSSSEPARLSTVARMIAGPGCLVTVLGKNAPQPEKLDQPPHFAGEPKVPDAVRIGCARKPNS